jgi:nucleoside-diphosphate-sugar epimerase
MSERVVFLTGGTGFIGTRLVRRLLASGMQVRCLVRSAARAESLRAAGAQLLVGEITDQGILETGMRGCALAYHLAAVYDIGVIDRNAMEHTNVDGTRAFLGALQTSSVTRGIYVSTTAALGPSESGESDRITEYSGPFPSHYHRTKATAHRLAREAQKRGVPLIIVCPAFVYGPGDNGPGGRFMSDLLRKRVPGLLTDPAWFSYVHVDDVVEGLILAGEHGRIGATYVLSGEAESVTGFARRVAQLAEIKPPLLRFPPFMASATGTLLDAMTRLTGLKFPISREAVAVTAGHRWLHTHEPATKELNWKPRSLAQGLPETVNWFLAQSKS